jgi:hypothetical protein
LAPSGKAGVTAGPSRLGVEEAELFARDADGGVVLPTLRASTREALANPGGG